MSLLTRRAVLAGAAVSLLAGRAAANGYRAYAEGLLARLPPEAAVRPDLEAVLDRLAAAARRSPLTASDLLRVAARAQAAEMLAGDFVGHKSASGYRFRQRFEAFADPDERGDFGENAARDRGKGPVDEAKARRLFRQWLDSAGHKRNLTNRWYAHVSTGAIAWRHHLYAVQIFWER